MLLHGFGQSCPWSGLGFSLKSSCFCVNRVLRGVRVEYKAGCCNEPNERFIKFAREFFYKDIEKLNENRQWINFLSLK